MRPLKILFAAAEMAPRVKVGGLGDVIGSLPHALSLRGHDVRVLLPAYAPSMLEESVSSWPVHGFPGKLHELSSADGPGVLLFETPGLLRRGGRPYVNRAGGPWADNALQFGRLSRVASDIGSGRLLPAWQPDIVHCHDWHTGLTPVWMKLNRSPAASVFTIHNLAHIGRFPASMLARLGLPGPLLHPEALEFHGDIAFLKGGLVFADRLTTVSPTYAREIKTPAEGHGLDGLIRFRGHRLTGIVNGIDTELWDPASDRHLRYPFDADRASEARGRNREWLSSRLGLVTASRQPLLAWVGRLAEQKGADILIDSLPDLMERGVSLVILGEGERRYSVALTAAARRWPDRLAFCRGFDEALAHQFYGAADLLLMPSRFEPCGISQLCAMRYGALPVTSRVGGLVDTVIDPMDDGAGATGFHMTALSREALLESVDRALGVYRHPAAWRRMRTNAMGRNSGWSESVERLEAVYRAALEDHGTVLSPDGTAHAMVAMSPVTSSPVTKLAR